MKRLFVKEPSNTEVEIDRLENLRADFEPWEAEYETINKRLLELQNLKKLENEKGLQITGDTLLKVGGMIFLGAVIVFKENLIGPIASKATGLLTKFV